MIYLETKDWTKALDEAIPQRIRREKTILNDENKTQIEI